MGINKSFISIALAILFFTATAQARFLQTDPIGYKDGMNWYSYVGDDPVNRGDPSGLRCTGKGGPNDPPRCTVDFVNVGSAAKPNWVSRADGVKSGKVTEKQVAKLEGGITKGYVASLKLGNNTVTVKGSGAAGTKDTKVSGNQIAQRLAGDQLNVDNRVATREVIDANGNTKTVEASAEATDPHRLTFFSGALNEGSPKQSVTTVHEAMHQIPALGQWSSADNTMLHQGPFREAAEEVVGTN